MISYALTLAGIIGATLIPVFAALYIVTNLKPIPTKYIAGAGVGLTFWFFFDTMGDAAQLDVNQSFGGGVAHAGIIIAFVAGVSALALFDHFAVPSSAPESGRFSKMLFIIPAGVALVMGVHGLGEGWDFASVASSATSQSLTDAFGGLSAVASYPMHKALEASIVASVYTVYVGRNSAALRKWHLPVLGLFFGLPSVIGSSIGYYVSFNTTYFYAFGVTAALYAALRLSEGVISKSKTDEQIPAYLGWKVFFAVLIGFLLLYTAALFH